MENTKTVEFTPAEAVAYCQNKLADIPYTVKQQATVGQPIAEVISVLEQLRQAMLAAPSSGGDAKCP